MEIQTIGVPEEAIELAKAMAAKAKELGIEAFSTEIDVTNDSLDRNSYMNGSIRVHYKATDGRGRPCENLSIRLNTTNVLNITVTPESSN